MNPVVRNRRSLCLLMLASSAACGVHYQPGPRGPVTAPSIVDVPPDRPRYRYREPADTPKLHAQRVVLELVDAREPARSDVPGRSVLDELTPADPIEVSTHRDFASALEQRLRVLADGDPTGPVVTLSVHVQHVLVWRGEERREIEVELSAILQTNTGPLVAATGKSERVLTGPPYDETELDELHLGTCLEALDGALSPSVMVDANKALAAEKAPAPSQEQT